MDKLIYIVQGFGPGPESSPLTVPARFYTPSAAKRHACLIGTFCNDVTISTRCGLESMAVATSATQEKARMGNSGF